MKTLPGVTSILLFLFVTAFFNLNAQTNNEIKVEILPAKENGFVKILFVGGNSSNVRVKFYNEKGLYTVDVIGRNTFQKGFLKKYDIRNVRSGESFWIDVSQNDFIASYKMIHSKDLMRYEPSLEQTQFNHMITASKD
jgi:hypothetical protein